MVKRFRDAWVHRDTTALAATLDAFIGYGTACVDSNGNVFLGAGLDVDSVELAAARLFKLGSASHPPAVSIDVDLGPMEVETGIADSIYERGVFCSPRVVIRTATDTLHLGGFTGFLLVRPHGPAAVPADTTGWHILTWVEIATSEPPSRRFDFAGMRPVLRAALQQAAAQARGGPGASRTHRARRRSAIPYRARSGATPSSGTSSDVERPPSSSCPPPGQAAGAHLGTLQQQVDLRHQLARLSAART